MSLTAGPLMDSHLPYGLHNLPSVQFLYHLPPPVSHLPALDSLWWNVLPSKHLLFLIK